VPAHGSIHENEVREELPFDTTGHRETTVQGGEVNRAIVTVGLFVCAVLRASSAQGQGNAVLPLLDSATMSGNTLTCWFGYTSVDNQVHVVPLGGANFFIPGPINRGQPTNYLPGVHRKAFSVAQDMSSFQQMSWTLGVGNATCTAADAVHLSPAPSPDPASALLKVQDAEGTYRLLVTPEATLIDAPSGVAFYTDATRTNGVYLGAGSGSWSTLSDVNRKIDFAAVNTDAVLERVARLPVYTWSYIGEGEGVRHIGPTAQDFRAAFGLGDSDRSIATVDLDGVNLAALKALEQRVRAIEARQNYIIARLDGQSAAAPAIVSQAPENTVLPVTVAVPAKVATPATVTEDTLLNVRKGGETYLTVTNSRVTAVAPAGLIIRTGPSTDVHLAPGSGSWSITSDRAAKHSIAPVEGERVLAGIRGLDISAWRYIGEAAGVKHIGPTAQDFFAAFGLGDNNRTISIVDADGVTLAGIKALTERLRTMQARLREFESR